MSDMPVPNTPPDLPRSKADLLDRVPRSRGALEDALAGLSAAQLTAAGPDGGWSVKDHLAHIAAWEQILLGVLAGRPEHEVFGVDENALATLDTDGLNAILDVRHKAQPLSDVLAEFARSYNQTLAALASLAEADLFAPVAPDDPRPRMQKIASDTYAHYDEHRTWIAALLARR